ncbi:MAG: hypothetical protein LKJ94_07355 [Candidatus Methanomethylophilus sp.]|jgi:DNA-binding MarR family transcriptional regulator|nr:hypothetical protein [Methanomethylophilus sp.]MCI2075487.1 hypothetical protein [Methanomethylophilus sp.]MCI2093309.1 hypothetical protein [Methanomethylophilus sp.]WII08822.1 helix-turn-helix domain-containing protein [Methanomassiliicoccales archaeon LGM-DZ1]
MTSEASIRAYRAIPDLEARQARVLACVRDYPGVSSRDISRILHMEQHNVCCRLGELMKSGQVHVVGTKTDRLTHREVRQYEACGNGAGE